MMNPTEAHDNDSRFDGACSEQTDMDLKVTLEPQWSKVYSKKRHFSKKALMK